MRKKVSIEKERIEGREDKRDDKKRERERRRERKETKYYQMINLNLLLG